MPTLSDIDLGEYQAFLGKPHFTDIRDGVASLDEGDFDTFWTAVSPVIGRVVEALGYEMEEARQWVEANRSIAVAIRNPEGDVLVAGLAHAMTLAELPNLDGGVLAALLDCGGEWPNLDKLEKILDAASANSGGRPLVIWSPSALPTLEGWAKVELEALPRLSLIRPGKDS